MNRDKTNPRKNPHDFFLKRNPDWAKRGIFKNLEFLIYVKGPYDIGYFRFDYLSDDRQELGSVDIC